MVRRNTFRPPKRLDNPPPIADDTPILGSVTAIRVLRDPVLKVQSGLGLAELNPHGQLFGNEVIVSVFGPGRVVAGLEAIFNRPFTISTTAARSRTPPIAKGTWTPCWDEMTPTVMGMADTAAKTQPTMKTPTPGFDSLAPQSGQRETPSSSFDPQAMHSSMGPLFGYG